MAEWSVPVGRLCEEEGWGGGSRIEEVALCKEGQGEGGWRSWGWEGRGGEGEA